MAGRLLMAAQPKVKPVAAHHVTAKQLAADRANLKKARAVARKLPRTAKQKAASRHSLAKARAAQAARRGGKKAVTAKKPQAARPGILMPSGNPEQLVAGTDGRADGAGPGGFPETAFPVMLASAGSPGQPTPQGTHPGLPALHDLPACAPVALAEHLAFWTGITATADQILALHEKTAGDCTLADLLGLVMVEGLAGIRLESFRRCDPDLLVPGWVYGLDSPGGYHAVLAHPAGTVVSWGRVLPWPGAPREAWHIEWEVP